MSDDGTELFFALSYSVANKLGVTSGGAFTTNVVIAGLLLDTLEFRTPFPIFPLK